MRVTPENRTLTLLMSTWFIAHLCMWMNDVTAAWLMTSLSHDPLLIALVQTAANAPIFLLGLPAGALADMLDRRRLFIFTQFWGAGVALMFAILIQFDWITPLPLLLLVCANGMGLAMRWPVFAAMIPGVVPKERLRASLALTAVAGNSARIIGPLVAGLLIASLGPGWVFYANTLLCMTTSVLLLRWKHPPVQTRHVHEALLPAIKSGMRHVRESKAMRIILTRTAGYFFHSIILIALMPLIARRLPGAGPGTYSVLLSCMGVAGIITAISIPRIATRLGSETTLRVGRLCHPVAALMLAVAPNLWVAIPAMLIAGCGWILSGNTMTTSAQSVLPDQFRARGMAIHQMMIMGSGAVGAAFWGQVASMTTVSTALELSAMTMLLVFVFSHEFKLPSDTAQDATLDIAQPH